MEGTGSGQRWTMNSGYQYPASIHPPTHPSVRPSITAGTISSVVDRVMVVRIYINSTGPVGLEEVTLGASTHASIP